MNLMKGGVTGYVLLRISLAVSAGGCITCYRHAVLQLSSATSKSAAGLTQSSTKRRKNFPGHFLEGPTMR
eukprot:5170962-Amphidinium_carterae.2